MGDVKAYVCLFLMLAVVAGLVGLVLYDVASTMLHGAFP